MPHGWASIGSMARAAVAIWAHFYWQSVCAHRRNCVEPCVLRASVAHRVPPVTLTAIWNWTPPRRRANGRRERSGAAGRHSMNDGPGGPAASTLPVTGRSGAPAGVGGRYTAFRAANATATLTAARSMGARSRHQQLPASGRAAVRRRLPCHRRILAHHPAGRGDIGVRTPQRRRHRACRRGARHLPRQDEEPRRHARAADRDRSLPGRGQRRGVPRPRRAGGRARARGHRPGDRGRARGLRLQPR